MKYADLKAAAAKLCENPPSFKVSSGREAALLRLDELFGEADSEISPVLGRFYRDRVDAALDEIAAYKGKKPRFWKLYSSGFIIIQVRGCAEALLQSLHEPPDQK